MDSMSDLPEFQSDDELREWFDSADLSSLSLDQVLEVVVATHVQLVVGDEPQTALSTGTTGSIQTRPVLAGHK